MTTSTFFETVEALFHDWHYDHPRILYSLIRALKPETVVEVGTYRGYAACYMARALQENKKGHLYCIDDFSLVDHVGSYGDPVQHWSDNLLKCGVRGGVALLRGESTAVQWPDRVDFAYVDGWHSYLCADFDFYKCAERGATCICLDDTLNCIGPRKLIQDLDRDIWDVITFPNDNGLSILHLKVQRRITFSQELPGPGDDLTMASDAEIKEHLKAASAFNGVKYVGFNPGGPSITSAP